MTAMTGTPRRRPTLKTIAELSGLAVTTVSRALGDAPDISAQTKETVRRIASEVGYVPDRAGVRLRTGRTNVISLVVPTEEDALNMTPRLIAAVAGGLSGTPYHLVVVPEMPGQTLMDPVRYVVETRSADAVIINRIQPQDPRVAYMRAQGFPFVTHGRSDWRDDHAWFDYDNAAFGVIAVQRLVARGRRSLVLIGPPTDQSYGRDMLAGVRDQARGQGVTLHVPSGVSSDSPAPQIAASVAATLQSHPETDAIITASPHGAMAVVGALEAQGRAVGQGIDLFAKETFPFLSLFRPGILTATEDIRTAGLFLAKAAIHEITQGGRSHLHHLDTPA
ncbi:MAG: LacI family transcriptional regulator [Paracoccus hibiscisoli]|uniref:LacI family transcriptional regulator n=1 Tax=Paracoccus hibiscisoli TaxID=2023261 RepID=UPI00391A9880